MLLDTPGAFAEALTITPEQTEGPYYPTPLPLDDLGVSGPYGNTDGSGSWTMSGSYGASEVGSWQAQAVIGSSASLETSAPITIHISNG